MDPDEVLKLFKEHNALLEGHFLLSSGLHSPKYLQSALILQYPDLAEKLGKAIADKVQHLKPQCVASPAVGGIVIGQEIARELKIRHVYTERVDGKMTLRRQFEIQPEERVLITDSIITTGGAPIEVMQVVHANKATVVGIGVVVDRSSDSFKPNVPVESLLKIVLETYTPENCPLCQQKIPFVKPGSKK